MEKVISFIPPDRGRACDGCTKCCQWLSAEVFGFKFGDGLPCTFLNHQGCSIYESRPDVCRSFQCYWKIDLNVPKWLKPDNSNVIMREGKLGSFTCISIIFAGKPDNKIYAWMKEQALEGKNFIILATNEIISEDADFKKFVLVTSKEYT